MGTKSTPQTNQHKLMNIIGKNIKYANINTAKIE